MSNIFFTSDNHFFHKNIQKFCPTTRFGADVEEMNELMIERWNQQVRPHDTVYTLGDFSFGNDHQTYEVLCRLNGIKNLVYGNHDKVIKKSSAVQSQFNEISDYREIKIGDKNVVMFHFPMREWNRMHHGAYHLFGHVHGGMPEPWGRSMDVGIDTRCPADMGLWAWEEIDEILSQREILGHKH